MLVCCLLALSSDAVRGESSVKICACGEGSCAGACKRYALNRCVPFFDLCSGAAGGFVQITGDDSEYSGLFYTTEDCSGSPLANFAAACGTCNMALNVTPECSRATSSVSASLSLPLLLSLALLLSSLFATQ